MTNIISKKKVVTKPKSKALNKPDVSSSVILADEEKRADIELKKLQAKEKTLQLEDWQKRKLTNEDNKTNVDKMNSLRWLLESITIDEERTIMGSEPIFKPVFSDVEKQKIKAKMMLLMERY